MNTGVVDTFLDVFTQYIDSGFGLLGGEVAFLSSTLVVIDVTLAGLFWAWGADSDILARLVKKVLYVGVFAFIIGNFNHLSQVVFQSFEGLGLKAAGSSLSAEDFLHPGKIAQAGIDAGAPILQAASQLTNFVSFFENFIQIIVLLIGWVIVIVAFFVLAVQLFVTLIEFKLTTLAGFILVPFGLFGRTAFLAEKVLGNVVASGVKVLVLAVIVGIGSTLFSQFVTTYGGAQPTLNDVLALALASLCLMGLGIFGPGIATGLVSGAPQLGAGAAVGTAMTAGGLAVAGGMAASAGVSALAGLGRAGASVAGGAMAATRGGPPSGGSPSGGPSPGPAPAGPSGPSGSSGAAAQPSLHPAKSSDSEGGGGSGGSDSGGSSAPAEPVPQWAKRMRHGQAIHRGVETAAHAVGSGQGGGGSTSLDLSEGSE
jgi:type IV secretion system protein TrbL